MKRQFVAAASVALAFVTVGCAGSSSENPPPQAESQWSQSGAVVVGEKGGAQAAPYAPSGTAFEVRLDQTIDTRTSNPGDPLDATLINPIVASNGAVLIPAGTVLHGHVGAIERLGNGPRLGLEFDNFDLNGTRAPIGVRVLSAEQQEYQTLPSSTGVSNMQAQGESAQGHPGEPSPTEQILMNKGARLRLALTRPIVASTGSSNK